MYGTHQPINMNPILSNSIELIKSAFVLYELDPVFSKLFVPRYCFVTVSLLKIIKISQKT